MTDLLENVRTGDWLDAQQFDPIRWAVHGILPEGFGLFTGPPKAGKSWAAFGIALAVASGKPALGKIATGYARPVLVLALEDGDRRLQGRARHLLGEGVPIPANLHYITNVTAGAVLNTIEAWLAVHGDRAPLVVLDTLGRVMPPRAAGEDAYHRDYRIGAALKDLADSHPGTCLLVVHHTRKMTTDDWMDSTSGTNGLNGAADFTVSLARARNEKSGVLRVTGRDVAESEFAVTSDNGRWSIDGNSLAEAAELATARRSSDGLADDSNSTRILAYVNSQDGALTPKNVETATGISDARRYLARLAEAERIAKTGRGTYTRVPTVPMSHSDPLIDPDWDNGTHGTPADGEAS